MTCLNVTEDLSQDDIGAIGSKRLHAAIRESVDRAEDASTSTSRTAVVVGAERSARRRLDLA
jgi:hypothetical protein